MPDPKKMLGSFFGNLIQGIGKKKYQDFIMSEKERLGEKGVNQDRADQLISTSLEKALDPTVPYMERIQWMKLYKGHTGVDLPTPTATPGSEIGIPPGEAAKTQAKNQEQQPAELFDFFETATPTQQQDFLQKSAARKGTLADAEASKALAEKRRKETAEVGKPKPGGAPSTAAEKLKLDELKAQFSQLNTEYDDLFKMLPKDEEGNLAIDPNDPWVIRLNDIDKERKRVYGEIYTPEKAFFDKFKVSE